ncbi:hypothetical protein Leryth_025909 [Lithospermum erythrorhizon]|nr:hypothetical protein Leryth_025909 [Lithospermum erythrorhizon]
MSRLEARNYIQEYGQDIHHSSILELATLDYNMVQSQHRMELAELKRWWKQLGLVDKLSFARDRPLECFLWTVGILPEPKYSSYRIELAKTIAILLVIDDAYDSFGTVDDLILFTNAIQRWDLNAIEELPEYMKICYMALINTTNEISYKILKEHGHTVLPFLRSAWIYAIEGFMTEVNWSSKGSVPNLEEYLETRVSTAGAYMALVHLFFLIGKGVSNETIKLLLHPYPKIFSCAGTILRLWDDLGTAKEEQERGEVSTSIQLYMKENSKGFVDDYDDNETTAEILLLINGLWKELNGELISSTNTLPREIIQAAFNMARSSQVVYQHQEVSYIFNVDNYVQALFFTPL